MKENIKKLLRTLESYGNGKIHLTLLKEDEETISGS